MIELIKDGICKYCIVKDSCIEHCTEKKYEEFKKEANILAEVFSKWNKKTKTK